MKTRIVVSALLIVLLSIGISGKADAGPWRGRYGYCRPHAYVSVGCPRVAVYAPPVVAGGYYGGYYGRPRYRYSRKFYGCGYRRPHYHERWR